MAKKTDRGFTGRALMALATALKGNVLAQRVGFTLSES
jgi:hypothetical protein